MPEPVWLPMIASTYTYVSARAIPASTRSPIGALSSRAGLAIVPTTSPLCGAAFISHHPSSIARVEAA